MERKCQNSVMQTVFVFLVRKSVDAASDLEDKRNDAVSGKGYLFNCRNVLLHLYGELIHCMQF